MNPFIRQLSLPRLFLALIFGAALMSLPIKVFAQPIAAPSAVPTVAVQVNERMVPTQPETVIDTASMNFYSYWKQANLYILTPEAARFARRPLRAMMDPVRYRLIARENLGSLRTVNQLLCLNGHNVFTLSCERSDGTNWSRTNFACPSDDATDPVTLFPLDCRHLHVSTLQGRHVRVPTALPVASERSAAIAEATRQQNATAPWPSSAERLMRLLSAHIDALPLYQQGDAQALARATVMTCDHAANSNCPPTSAAGLTVTPRAPSNGGGGNDPSAAYLARIQQLEQVNAQRADKIWWLSFLMFIMVGLSLLIPIRWLLDSLFGQKKTKDTSLTLLPPITPSLPPTDKKSTDIIADNSRLLGDNARLRAELDSRTRISQDNLTLAIGNERIGFEAERKRMIEERNTAIKAAVNQTIIELGMKYDTQIAQLQGRVTARDQEIIDNAGQHAATKAENVRLNETIVALNAQLAEADRKLLKVEAEASTALDRKVSQIRSSAPPSVTVSSNVVEISSAARERKIAQLEREKADLNARCGEQAIEIARLKKQAPSVQRAGTPVHELRKARPTIPGPGSDAVPSATPISDASAANPVDSSLMSEPEPHDRHPRLDEHAFSDTQIREAPEGIQALARIVLKQVPADASTANPAQASVSGMASLAPPTNEMEDLRNDLSQHMADLPDLDSLGTTVTEMSAPTIPPPSSANAVALGLGGMIPGAEIAPDADTRRYQEGEIQRFATLATSDSATVEYDAQKSPEVRAAIEATRQVNPGAPRADEGPTDVRRPFRQTLDFSKSDVTREQAEALANAPRSSSVSTRPPPAVPSIVSTQKNATLTPEEARQRIETNPGFTAPTQQSSSPNGEMPSKVNGHHR